MVLLRNRIKNYYLNIKRSKEQINPVKTKVFNERKKACVMLNKIRTSTMLSYNGPLHLKTNVVLSDRNRFFKC